MCRLAAYYGPSIALSDLVTRPERSIIRQSYDARERLGGSGENVYEIGSLNADGFGIGWFPSEEAVVRDRKFVSPCVFKDLGPAWNNANLTNLCENLSSELIFAHVRAAGPGMGSCRCACHPFSMGRYLFMHNGQISDFNLLRRSLMNELSDGAFSFCLTNGSSDSSVAFAVFLDEIGWDRLHEKLTIEELSDCFRSTLRKLTEACDRYQVSEISMLNFVISDGSAVLASRCVHGGIGMHGGEPISAPSLYFSSGSRFEEELDHSKCSVKKVGKSSVQTICSASAKRYRMIRNELRDDVVIVSSEPLTETRSDWVTIPTNFMLLITEGKRMLLSPLNEPMLKRVLSLRQSFMRSTSSRYKSKTGSEAHPQKLELPSIDSPVNGGIGREAITNGSSIEPTEPNQYGLSVYSPTHFEGRHKSAILALTSIDDYVISTDSVAMIGHPNGLCVWDLDISKCVAKAPLYAGAGVVFAFKQSESSNRFIILAGCSDGAVYCWNLFTGQTRKDVSLVPASKLVMGEIGQLTALTAKGCRLLVGAQDARVRCIDLDASFFEFSKDNLEFKTFYLQPLVSGSKPSCMDNQIATYRTVSVKDDQKMLINGVNHLGTVTCLIFLSNFACSSGNDGIIRLWSNRMSLVTNFCGHCDSVYSLCAPDDERFLYSGSLDSTIRVWDLKTFQSRRSLLCSSPVLCLAIHGMWLISGHADSFIELRELNSLVLMLKIDTKRFGAPLGITKTCLRLTTHDLPYMRVSCGFNFGTICFWKIASKTGLLNGANVSRLGEVTRPILRSCRSDGGENSDGFFETLAQFITIRSVSADRNFNDQCWIAAEFVERQLSEFLGCDVVRACFDPLNPQPPVVIGSLNLGPLSSAPIRRLVIYGHYDVVDATSKAWNSDPWTMEKKNSYVYGRGVTDNKGPLLACICAAKSALEASRENTAVTFVFEGQEESGLSLKARRFDDVIQNNRDLFGGTSGILISNNYWIDNVRPCMTVGMRGVIDFSIRISGFKTDLHAGIHGGPINEPFDDLLRLLSSIMDEKRTPSFPEAQDNILSLSDTNLKLYQDIELDLDLYCKQVGVPRLAGDEAVDVLQSLWSRPSISVSCIENSNGGTGYRRIPGEVTAKVSMHFVPDQDAKVLESTLRAHLESEFKRMNSGNSLTVEVNQVSDWWVGDVSSDLFRVASKAIEEKHGVKPLLVREGGSYGGISSFLQDALDAPLVHLPMGQATDSPHLANERILVENLLKGKEIVEKIILTF